MSIAYNQYLKEHIGNVKKAYDWLCSHIPDVKRYMEGSEHIILEHDHSKYLAKEYVAYDNYFYGGNRSFNVVRDFNDAWLHHIHHNPHHWQHWILIHDDSPQEALFMPVCYVVEMICDWWSFSFKTGDLYEIFNWYEKHKDYMILHEKTRSIVENLLSSIRNELDIEKEKQQ